MAYKSRLFLFCCSLQILVSCKTIGHITQLSQTSIKEVRFLGAYEVEYGLQYGNTRVGGLSGIDYDEKRDQYYIISDDRSTINASRFYTARITIGQKGIDNIIFLDVTELLMPDGQAYPNHRKAPFHACDPEGIRFYPTKDMYVISSEGEKLITEKDTVLVDPFVHMIGYNGQYVDSFALPIQARVHATESGLRRNGAFEGISFADDYRSLYVSIEEPIYEDGPRAGAGKDSSAWIRIIKCDVTTRKPTTQYAYRIDPVTHPPVNAGGVIMNGVSEILSLDEKRLLVVERSFSAGRLSLSIRVYVADLTNASDISRLPSLKNTSFKPASKSLLLDMDSLNRHIDNIEGVCFGPLMPNGNRTLLFVADNNFNKEQKNQFLLFELLERK